MRVLIATSQVPFVYGGAEIHAENLLTALLEHGHQAEIVKIPFKWYPPEKILDHILACRLLDLSECNGVPVDRMIGLKFPAYLVPHPKKVLWILHQHRTAYDLWDHSLCDLVHYPNGIQIRDAIRKADKSFIPEAKAVFTNSLNVAKRLKTFCDIDSTPLYHPPPNADKFYCEPAEKYFFYPSRLCEMKRQDLVLEALSKTSHQVQMRFSGAPDNPSYLEYLQKKARDLGVENRVQWEGFISDERKRELYAHSLGVIFPPVDEDYGYITLESMLSSKPVITCSDSGGPLEFVLNQETGMIVEPDASALAWAMDVLWENPVRARAWGKAGKDRIAELGISWSCVVEKLLA